MGTVNPFEHAKLYDYLIDSTNRETDIQAALRRATFELEPNFSRMITAPEQVQFLELLVKLIGAKKAIEIGVFTGYGSLAIAQALPDDGLLIACDTSEEWPNIGKPFWQQAKVDHKIDLRLAPALDTLQSLNDQQGQFDFIFIDADKIHYDDYYEAALLLLRPGGLVVLDNVLWVAGEAVPDKSTPSAKAIDQLTQKIKIDPRVDISMIPLSAGMLLAQKNL